MEKWGQVGRMETKKRSLSEAKEGPRGKGAPRPIHVVADQEESRARDGLVDRQQSEREGRKKVAR